MTRREVAKLILVSVLLMIASSCQQSESEMQETAEPQEPVVLTTDERLANIQSELKAVKAEMTTKGEYNCCVQPTCDWCLLHEGNCTCYDNLKAKKEVCPGCGLGWHNGKGVIQGVKTAEVKWDITHEHAGAEHKH